ncbi:MAG: hypothetical protein QM796_05135 [Chthoniobacteraceae bacterium]
MKTDVQKIYDARESASIKGLRVIVGFYARWKIRVAHALLIAQAAKKT